MIKVKYGDNMFLIRTINSTIRFMTDDEMEISTFPIGITNTYKFLTWEQINELQENYKVRITQEQFKQIINYLFPNFWFFLFILKCGQDVTW